MNNLQQVVQEFRTVESDLPELDQIVSDAAKLFNRVDAISSRFVRVEANYNVIAQLEKLDRILRSTTERLRKLLNISSNG